MKIKSVTAENKRRYLEMTSKEIPAIVIIVVLLSFFGVMAFAAQDRFELKAPNGVAFSEIRGYETWQVIAPSYDNDDLKAILGNPLMINAYKEGIPGNGKPFPEGSIIVEISWHKRTTAPLPTATEPDTLDSVQLIVKDSERFLDTSGWGYGKFLYDAASDTFKPFGGDSSFAKQCYQCHTLVKAKDYIFTGYSRR